MTILIKNGRLINPSENLDKVMDIFVEDGIIKEKAESKQADTVIDAAGCYVMPGLIDLHVHFRDPGLTYKEDIETGSKAAAKGGFTTVCCMPNTKPVVDNVETVKYIIEIGEKTGLTNVLPVGAVTKNMAGVEITDVEELKKAGICAISEDGKSVMNSGVYRKAMKNAAKANVPVLAHCEDINLVEGGVINLGDKSSELGVKGISNAVEDVSADYQVRISAKCGDGLHELEEILGNIIRSRRVYLEKVYPYTQAGKLQSIRKYGQLLSEEYTEEGIKVTAEVCPHHFSMCSDDITSNDGNFKMNPPLRAREDMEALIKGLQDDIMDVISTDHAPHSAEEKAKDLEHAPFGIVGLETSVALTVTNLVKKGYLTPMQMAAKMSYNPAKVLGIPKGTLDEGKIADITIINPDKEYTIDVNTFESKGKNTPFDGYKVSGEVEYTILNGKVVYSNK